MSKRQQADLYGIVQQAGKLDERDKKRAARAEAQQEETEEFVKRALDDFSGADSESDGSPLKKEDIQKNNLLKDKEGMRRLERAERSPDRAGTTEKGGGAGAGATTSLRPGDRTWTFRHC